MGGHGFIDSWLNGSPVLTNESGRPNIKQDYSKEDG